MPVGTFGAGFLMGKIRLATGVYRIGLGQPVVASGMEEMDATKRPRDAPDRNEGSLANTNIFQATIVLGNLLRPVLL